MSFYNKIISRSTPHPRRMFRNNPPGILPKLKNGSLTCMSFCPPPPPPQLRPIHRGKGNPPQTWRILLGCAPVLRLFLWGYTPPCAGFIRGMTRHKLATSGTLPARAQRLLWGNLQRWLVQGVPTPQTPVAPYFWAVHPWCTPSCVVSVRGPKCTKILI